MLTMLERVFLCLHPQDVVSKNYSLNLKCLKISSHNIYINTAIFHFLHKAYAYPC